MEFITLNEKRKTCNIFQGYLGPPSGLDSFSDVIFMWKDIPKILLNWPNISSPKDYDLFFMVQH